MASHPSEVAAIIAQHRTRKAAALAEVLRDAQIDSALARKMDDHAWHIAAAKAGVKPPSEDTRELAIQMLEAREHGQRGKIG